MRIQEVLVLAGAARAFAGALPRASYGEHYKPLVNSKGIQDAITTEKYDNSYFSKNSLKRESDGISPPEGKDGIARLETWTHHLLITQLTTLSQADGQSPTA